MIRWFLVASLLFVAGRLPAQRTWQTAASGVMSNLNAVTNGNGLWVAVGDNGVITTSPDGMLWTPRGSGTSENLLAVAYGAGRFVATRPNRTSPMLTSADGINWLPGSVLDANGLPASTSAYNAIAFGGGRFLAAGDNLQNLIVSTDGQTFRILSVSLPVIPDPPSIIPSTSITCLAYRQGRFLALTNLGIVLQNTDGSRWEWLFSGWYEQSFVAVTGNEVGEILAVGPVSFQYRPANFSTIGPVFPGSGGNPRVRTPANVRAATFSGVCSGPDGFLAVDTAGAILTLGRDFWRTRANFGGVGVGFRSVAYDGFSQFVAVGTATATHSAIIAASPLDSFRPPTYRIEQIGPLPGTPPRTGWAAYAINNSGQVTGGAAPYYYEGRPFLYSNGVLSDLGWTGWGWGTAINPAGQVVGNIGNYSGHSANVFPGRNYPFLAVDPAGSITISTASGINSAAIMVGGFSRADPPTHAYSLELSTGRMTDLGAIAGFRRSYATAINDRGDIIGVADLQLSNGDISYPQGFLYANQVMSILPSLGGATTYPYAVNASGAVTGSSATFDHPTAAFPLSAFRYQAGTTSNLDNINCDYSYGLAINARGDVVGEFGMSQPQHGAFLYTNGDMFNLADLLGVSGTGWRLAAATGINDAGQIVGYATNGANPYLCAFLATPTVESPLTATTLINISSRLHVGTGENVGIAGFSIKGGSKKILIRAIGPSLANSAVADPVANPLIQLLDANGVLLQENDNWKSVQQAEIEATGLAPRSELESAIVVTLVEGNYTAIVRGVAGTTGVAVVEVYDLDPTGAARLQNISTRAQVLTGDNVLIAGFVIAGNRDKRVVVRAIGPDLASAGIVGPLPNPVMEIYDASGTKIFENDDWYSGPGNEVSAAGLAPNNPLDSASGYTLGSGAYTVIVRGVGNTTGVGVVEVYEIP